MLRSSGRAKVGSDAKKTVRSGSVEGEFGHRDRTSACSRRTTEVTDTRDRSAVCSWRTRGLADTRDMSGKLCTQEKPVVHTTAAGVGGWRVASVWEEEDPPTESESQDG